MLALQTLQHVHHFELYFETFHRKSRCIFWSVWQKSGAQSSNSGPFGRFQSDTPQSTATEARFRVEKWLIEEKPKVSLDRSLTGQGHIWEVTSPVFLSFLSLLLFIFFLLLVSVVSLSLDTVMSAGCALWTVPAVMGRAGRWAAGGVVVPGAQEEVWTLR